MTRRCSFAWARLGVLPVWLCTFPGSAAESPYLYGIHDHEPAPTELLSHITNATGAGGWITATVAVGANTNDFSGANFTSFANSGHTMICRINYGYFPDGTIPVPAKYEDFAVRCRNFVTNSPGCSIWLIGNELNLAAEWPFDGARFNYVSPQSYATLFRKVYNAIKSIRPDDRVLPQASAPWGGPYGPTTFSVNGTEYPADGQALTWVQYENQMLAAITNTGPLDGIALHVGSRGYSYADIHSTNTFGGLGLYSSFYVYKDWIEYGIPPGLYSLPLYVTECNGLYYWTGTGPPGEPATPYQAGWMQEIYAEINRYNQAAATNGKPIFRCVNLYRWCAYCDGWNIDADAAHPNPYKAQILADLDAAAAQRYAWPAPVVNTNPPPAPTGLSAAVGNATVTLNWNAAAYATSYSVKRSTISGGPYSVIASNVTGTTCVNTSFAPGTTYYYCVSARNSFGESSNSTQVSARPTNGLPDLVVTAISWSPANLLSGTGIVFRATVKNNGSAATPSGITLGVGFSVSDGGNYTWSGSFNSALAPGASVILSADGGNSGNQWLARAGAWTVTANVDDVDRILESLENNNLFSSNFNVFKSSSAVNSGGAAASPFEADDYVSGGNIYAVADAIDTSLVLNPAPQAVYQTERWGNFTYTFPNLMPGAAYRVRLHWAEIFQDGPGARQFNAAINGTGVLTNFDVFAAAGGKFRALVKEFHAVADGAGAITCAFTPGALDNPKSSGVELSWVYTPPILAPVPAQFVNAGGRLAFTASAFGTNIPPHPLTFSLDADAPAGATIDAATGLFAWGAPSSTVALTNSATIRVTDNGAPALTDFKTFAIIVMPPPRLLGITCTNVTVTLACSAFPGKSYRLLTSTNLAGGSWAPLGPDVFAAGFSLSFSDAITSNERFYKVQQVN